MQKHLNKLLKKHKKDLMQIGLYILILIGVVLILSKAGVFEGKKVIGREGSKDYSVRISSVEEIPCSSTSIEQDNYTCQTIGFHDPKVGTYKEITLENLSEHQRVKKGDKILVYTFDNNEYHYGGADRKYYLLFLLIIFIIVTIITGGILGIKSIFSLTLSFFVLIYGVIPFLEKGYNPILVIFASGSVILAISLFFLYGIKKTSIIAFSGTFVGLVLSLGLSLLFTNILKLTGIEDEYSSYLLSNFQINFDIRDLMLGSFVLGTIGAIDDVSMSQVFVVEELLKAKKKFSTRKLYSSAMRVGRSHVASMINTLFMAYFAASLTTILIFIMRDYTVDEMLRREFLASEIVRTLIGTIGLIVSVPITTFLACFVLKGEYKK